MKILFTLAHGYLPQGFGGLQKDIDSIARALIEKDHEVVVLASLMHGKIFGLASRVKLKLNQMLNGRRLVRDTVLGYPVWRTWFPWNQTGYFPDKEIRYILEKEKPDVVVVSSGAAVRIALTVKEAGVPFLMFLADVEFKDHLGSFEELGNVPCIANSNFTAAKHRDAFGVNPTVIYPFIDGEDYKTKTTQENVTFINPNPHKGLTVATEIARRCPEIPFVFNENWPLTDRQREELQRKMGNLPNVTFCPPQNDMRKVYGKCKILLAPSLWEEAYGRISTEAQFSGIPVIASRRGGLPESVGPGGVLLDPEGPIDAWVNALRKLWEDKEYYDQLSDEAFDYASRSENSVSHKADSWESELTTLYRAGKSGSR